MEEAMIKGFTLTKDYIQFVEGFEHWEEAVIQSAQPLLKHGHIKQSYIDGMIESVKEYGPYIVIAPRIALPHARPEMGSVSVGYSVMLSKKPVSFMEDNSSDAELFIALSCVDADTHLQMLQEIVEILSDNQKQSSLFNAKTVDDVLKVFNE